ERPAGPVVLDAPGEDGLPAGEHRACRGLAFARWERLTLVVDGELRAGLRREASHGGPFSRGAGQALRRGASNCTPWSGGSAGGRTTRGPGLRSSASRAFSCVALARSRRLPRPIGRSPVSS